MQVDASEVAAMLIAVANGSMRPIWLDDSRYWRDPRISDKYGVFDMVNCGTTTYHVGGWVVCLCIDGCGWDYVDYVITPDGRRGEYDDWNDPPSKYLRSDWEGNKQPASYHFLTDDIFRRMCDAFNSAPYGGTDAKLE